MKLQNGLLKELSAKNIRINFNDDIFINTDRKEYYLSNIDCVVEKDTYIFETEDATFSVGYTQVADTSFIVRSIRMCFKNDTDLLKIGIRVPKSDEQFMYETFYNASAAAFFRKGEIGYCCGFENPYCRLDGEYLYFEPSLQMKAGKVFECDLNFYGIYELYGEKIQPELNRTQVYVNGRNHPRYRNPGEGVALYFSEILEFNKYTRNYFNCDRKEFKFMTYDFFGNMPQRPQNEEEFRRYIEHIDAVSDIGCDTILLNPLFPNKIPDENENSCWELFPEDTYAEEILKYARTKGLKVGMYTGTAGNGKYGNSSMICYVDKKEWKKIDVLGNTAEENCIADDEFVDWYINVQKNTIKKYKLDVWAWDPGPGNAFFCHSENHGHLPGKGAYKGFRNSLKIMKALKDEFSRLYFQGFHGNKEYGLWGFKYIDQHEAFWENEVYVMNPVFDDLSVDRITANNIRQQSVWNYYFRFMPATLNHGITHRMVQSCLMKMPELDLVFDYTGWKYALLSAIAYGGPITITILPRYPKVIKEYLIFYKKWIAFAKDIFKYSKYSLPIGSQVGCGIDAVAKLKDNTGYIFVFNPFSQNYEFNININERCGFEKTDNKIYFNMLYPYVEEIPSHKYGENVNLVVPAYECIVLQASTQRNHMDADCTIPALPRVLEKNASGNYSFYADNRIKELLGEYQLSEEEITVQETYAERFKRINSVWSRPDRLWLFVKSDNASAESQILINGKRVLWRQDVISHNELNCKSMIFADITELVEWDKENKIEMLCFDEEFLYLHYPKPQNEQLPEKGKKYLPKAFNAPVLDDEIEIISAKINEDNVIVPETENVLTAIVNIPYEELEGVYASVPISIGNTGHELRRDMALEYQDGKWMKVFKSGKRIDLIIDDNKISIWAVTKKNRESKTYHLSINWLLI